MEVVPMIAIAKREVERRDERLQEKFVTMLPIIIRYARVAFRMLAPEARQEAIQETIAAAWAAFKRLAERGKLDVCYPTPLAMYSVRRVRAGRQLGCRLNSFDLLSRYAQRRRVFQVQRLDQLDQHDRQWKEVLIEDGRAGPAEIAICRIDFAEWLRRLTTRLRKIALALASGETTKSVAAQFGLSPARISQLREWLRKSWEAFQGGPEIGGRPQPAAV
jgi:hypothetical protein